MIILKIIGILLLVLILLLLIAVIRTLIFIPAKHSEFVSKRDETREKIYAEKLSKMVQYETVSVKGVNQRDKFVKNSHGAAASVSYIINKRKNHQQETVTSQ